MSTHISSQAEAAREAHRDPTGKFGRQPASEADLALDEATHEAEREQTRELVVATRALSIDPATGAAPKVIRNYSWQDDDPDSGDFAMWSEDLLNTPPGDLSDQALDDLNSTNSFIEEAAGDSENATAQDVAQSAYDTHWGYDAASTDFQDSEDRELWVALARSARGEQPTAAQATMAAEVPAHRLTVVSSRLTGTTARCAGGPPMTRTRRCTVPAPTPTVPQPCSTRTASRRCGCAATPGSGKFTTTAPARSTTSRPGCRSTR